MASVMAIVMASVMAIIITSVIASNDFGKGLHVCEAKVFSLLEVALKRAGGKDYYVLSGKEDFLDSINCKMIECQQRGFLASSTMYEGRNDLDTEFKIKGDYRGVVINEKLVKSADESFAKGDLQALPVGTVALVSSSEECTQKKSKSECVTVSQPIPPKSILRHERGFNFFDCKFEVSLKVNDGSVTFSSWIWKHWPLIWKWWGYLETVPARDVLSKVKGWDNSKGTAIIELQCKVETERDAIDKI